MKKEEYVIYFYTINGTKFCTPSFELAASRTQTDVTYEKIMVDVE